ncbi:MAG: hypothetical protein KDG50_09535 [Chromatiales bacterium]|nr:hypothetical protein [Chromatiales bacterium]
MPIDLATHSALAVAWLGYFALHSVAASLGVKRAVAQRWPGAMRGYRLAFNAVALAALALPLWLSWSIESPWLWRFSGAWRWVADGLAVAAIGGFLFSLRGYDGGEFIGLRQWRDRARGVEDQERLKISTLHRYVRHPWYLFAIVLIWTRDMNLAWLISAVAISAYFKLGSLLEERKLIVYHGDAYARYRDAVPGIVPRPWRHLNATQAREIEAQSRHG